jgi:hypothetical protein
VTQLLAERGVNVLVVQKPVTGLDVNGFSVVRDQFERDTFVARSDVTMRLWRWLAPIPAQAVPNEH